jgi:hypothetical protein
MEAMAVLIQRLQSLAQLTGNKLVIESDRSGVSIQVGDSTYHTDLLNTDSLASALLHLSLGAKIEKGEEK